MELHSAILCWSVEPYSDQVGSFSCVYFVFRLLSDSRMSASLACWIDAFRVIVLLLRFGGLHIREYEGVNS